MSQFGLSFHHLGLAVKKPGPALAFLRGLGYATPEPVFDPEQGVHLILCTHPSAPAVEVIYPGVNPGPVDALVTKHTKGIVYHCCYVAEDVEASLRALERAGLEPFCVSPQKPAVLFGGARVSFHQIVGMGLVEIIEGQPR
jgi:hypothetical protein